MTKEIKNIYIYILVNTDMSVKYYLVETSDFNISFLYN